MKNAHNQKSCGSTRCCGSAATADAAGSFNSDFERRKSIRVPHRATFHIQPLQNDGAGGATPVVLQDLSATGMGIMHPQPLQLGEQYQIPLVRESESLICTVVRCEQLDEGLFNIGFEFNSSARAVDEGHRQLTGKPTPREPVSN